MLLYLTTAGTEFYIGQKLWLLQDFSFCTRTAYRLSSPMIQVWNMLGQHVAHLSDFYLYFYSKRDQ